MPRVKSIKAGKRLPNTVEVTPLLTFAKTFDEIAIKKSGFTIMEVLLQVDRKHSSTPKGSTKVAGITVSWHEEVRQRYRTIRLTNNYNKILKALCKFDCNTNWPIKEIKLMNNRTENIITLKSIGSKINKKMIVYNISGVNHTVYDLDEIMKEVSELFFNTCFFKDSVSSMICNI
jgi:hypothetical protein